MSDRLLSPVVLRRKYGSAGHDKGSVIPDFDILRCCVQQCLKRLVMVSGICGDGQLGGCCRVFCL